MAKLSLEERFWSKVRKTDTCWLWTASKTGNGYGQFVINGKKVMAHRWAYESVYGTIPTGLELDHVFERGCINRHCVNWRHLEAITKLENIRRGLGGAYWRNKTHCPRGHAYDTINTCVYSGRRFCLACRRFRWKRAKALSQPTEDT